MNNNTYDKKKKSAMLAAAAAAALLLGLGGIGLGFGSGSGSGNSTGNGTGETTGLHSTAPSGTETTPTQDATGSTQDTTSSTQETAALTTVTIQVRQGAYLIDGQQYTLEQIEALISQKDAASASYILEDNYASAQAWDAIKALFLRLEIAVVEQ